MNEDRRSLVARTSAEISVSAGLKEACQWLIGCQHNPISLAAGHLPGLARHAWLRVAHPITAPRALLCTLWLLEEVDRGDDCLIAGTLRFVAHPTAAGVKVSFEGLMVRTDRAADDAALQLLELIASAIAQSGPSQTASISAAG